MPEEIASRPSFPQALEKEVERVLGDPVFQRSPILSRLLRFLCDMTMRNMTISQFAIAVDGLGRPEDYDQDVDSYPRVQISRLRKALADYYARHQPGDGLCVALRQGDYALRLLPSDHAYPDRRRPPDIAGDPAPEAERDTKPTHFGALGQSALIKALAACAAVVAISAGVWLLPSWWLGPPPLTAVPRISVIVDGREDGNGSLPPGLHDLAEREARRLIAASLVGRNARPGVATYSLFVDLGSGSSRRPEAFVRLDDANDYTVFAQSFPIEAERERFLSDFDSILTDIFSPSGVIAEHLAENFAGRAPQSSFECQLAIETGRASGGQIGTLLDNCLAAYPDSPLASYWLARQSFAEYQAVIRTGRTVGRDGLAWSTLVRALDRDRYNPFANAVAAKVELAAQNCPLGQVHFDRAMTRGKTFPALAASVTADMLPCLDNSESRDEASGELSEIVARHPDPDPVLRVYLVLSALELGQRDVAKTMLRNAITRPRSGGAVAYSLNTLEQALDGAPVQPDRLRSAIGMFVWNPKARQIILNTLDAG